MKMTLLEKARAGRLAALASLETQIVKSDAIILQFDSQFAADRRNPVGVFVSKRANPQENLFAA